MTTHTVEPTPQVPAHVGIILDGNRRWAASHGLKPMDGHKQGAEVFKAVSLAAFERGVRYLSAYVFSTENWRRTDDEVTFLMKLLIRAVELHLDEFHRRNIKIIVLGSRKGLNKNILKTVERTETKTANNTAGTLALCFNYGGKAEIVAAVQDIVQQGIAPEEISAETIDAHLYAPEVPPVDLLIRTSGEHRTSGFMLWRADYAELYFSDKLWPDYTIQDFDQALNDYAQRKRRFGV